MRNFKPVVSDRRQRPIYEPSTGTRELRVVVDADLNVHDDVAAERLDVLKGLLGHKLTKCWRYDGRTVPGMELVSSGVNPAIRKGWVEVGPAAPGDGLTHHVLYWENDSLRVGGIDGDVARGEFARSEPTYAHLDPAEAATRRNADSVLLGAADEIRADLVVTDRRFLLDGHWFPSLPTLPCTLDEALVLVAQFLRLRGVYLGWPHEEQSASYFFNRGLYFWIATRAALPESWRWFTHCLEAGRQSGDDDISHTAQAVLHRVERSLMARDALRWHLTLKQNNDVADDALAEVDHILVDLVGAFDAMARVAHQVLNLPSGDLYMAGWQKREWLRAVQQVAPSLAAVMTARDYPADVFEVIRVMRNTVHGAGLTSMGIGRLGSRRDGTVVALSAADTQNLMAVVERHGWAAEWGLTEFIEGRVYLDPGAFVEHVVQAAVPILNDLMRETPVERLGCRPGANTEPPQSDLLSDPFALRHQRSILYQLGFGDLARVYAR